MDSKQRLDLSKLIKEYDTEETTDKIRELRHSSLIRQDIGVLELLKKKYSRLRFTNKDQFKSICQKQVSFLFNNYTNIFNKVVNDELDLEILVKFISILEKIEIGELDQHEASFAVGNILKEMYIDSALKKEKKNAKKDLKNKKIPKKTKNISWNEFKQQQVE